MMKINAPQCIFTSMLKRIMIGILLSISTQLPASEFGPLPSKIFGDKGTLSCTSKDNCKIPSYRSLHKAAEEFINHSDNRLGVLNKIEAEIRSAEQLYELEIEEVFSSTGNSEVKSFLQKGKKIYSNLPELLGLSTARLLVGGQSPFIEELKSLMELLKNSDADIINSKTDVEKKEQRLKREDSYKKMRLSGEFESYKHIDQVKEFSNFYVKNGSLTPWFKGTNQLLRLSFKSCPLIVRRKINKLKPELSFNRDKTPLKIDIFNESEMVKSLVQNSRLMNISCEKLDRGLPGTEFDPNTATLKVKYVETAPSKIILPRF